MLFRITPYAWLFGIGCTICRSTGPAISANASCRCCSTCSAIGLRQNRREWSLRSKLRSAPLEQYQFLYIKSRTNSRRGATELNGYRIITGSECRFILGSTRDGKEQAEDRYNEGAEKTNAIGRVLAPKPPFSWKRKRHGHRSRRNKQKIQIQRNRRERERAEKPNAFGRKIKWLSLRKRRERASRRDR
jgi:hypothetical protein